MNRWLFACLCVVFVMIQAASANESSAQPAAEFAYDSEQDRLTLRLNEVALSGVLARISLATGIGILYDPEAESMITIQMHERTLEDGLRQLLQESSYVFYYGNKQDENGNQQQLLTGVRVLPKGKSDNSNLRPVVELEAEAYRRALNLHKHSKTMPSGLDYTTLRWQARLANAPAALREKLLKNAEARVEKYIAREKARAERQAEKAAKKAAHNEEREKKYQIRMEALKESNPELYEIKKQRHEENKRQAIERVKVANSNTSDNQVH